MKMYSESKPPDNLPGEHQVPKYELHYADQDNVISLVDMWRVIAARKKFILLSVLVAVLVAVAYIFLAEPLYRAETNLLSPQQQDVYGLRVDFRGKESFVIKKYTPDLVFKTFLQNFKSKRLRKEFYDEQHLVDYYLKDKQHTDANVDRIFEDRFNSDLQVQIDEQGISFAVASFEYSDPVQSAQWLNQFVAFIKERTRDLIIDEFTFMIQAEIKQVRYQSDNLLKLAERKRHDQIQQLSEALRVAKTLDAKGVSGLVVEIDEEQASIEVKTPSMPLYLRGVRALKSEIQVLESRKSDEAFISELRDLQEKSTFLENVSIDRDAVSVVTIDTAAKTPYRAQRPKKILIVLLAATLGMLIGIFLVFIAEISTKAHRES